MFDAARRRAIMIEMLECALGIANEIDEHKAAYLIERALDEARASIVPGMERANP